MPILCLHENKQKKNLALLAQKNNLVKTSSQSNMNMPFSVVTLAEATVY